MSTGPQGSQDDLNEAKAELRRLGAAIRQARDAVGAGAMIDMAALEPEVTRLCGHLAGMPAGVGAALKPEVQALIADFAALTELIEARLAGLREKAAGGGPPPPDRSGR